MDRLSAVLVLEENMAARGHAIESFDDSRMLIVDF